VKHPGLIRDRVAARVLDMLEHLRIQISMLAEPDYEVLRLLERPSQFEVGTKVAEFLMGQLGDTSQPKEPRFSKTRRAMAKRRGRPPRGERRPTSEASQALPPAAEVPNG
jgi:hypothetical protein